MKYRPLAVAASVAALMMAGAPAQAKVEGDTITLGSSISLTGKLSEKYNQCQP